MTTIEKYIVASILFFIGVAIYGVKRSLEPRSCQCPMMICEQGTPKKVETLEEAPLLMN